MRLSPPQRFNDVVIDDVRREIVVVERYGRRERLVDFMLVESAIHYIEMAKSVYKRKDISHSFSIEKWDRVKGVRVSVFSLNTH